MKKTSIVLVLAALTALPAIGSTARTLEDIGFKIVSESTDTGTGGCNYRFNNITRGTRSFTYVGGHRIWNYFQGNSLGIGQSSITYGVILRWHSDDPLDIPDTNSEYGLTWDVTYEAWSLTYVNCPPGNKRMNIANNFYFGPIGTIPSINGQYAVPSTYFSEHNWTWAYEPVTLAHSTTHVSLIKFLFNLQTGYYEGETGIACSTSNGMTNAPVPNFPYYVDCYGKVKMHFVLTQMDGQPI